MAPATIPELAADPVWGSVAVISDLHLQEAEAATFEAWARFMAAPGADAVFILGDLFEAWPGDDVLDASTFEARCARVLRESATRRPVFFMHGNRDFLVGEAFAREAGVRLLADPIVLAFGGHRWLLSHGDLLCLEDTDYLRFREQVRDPAWQRELLARPLAERQALARSLRTQSEDRKRSGVPYADVDGVEARAWLGAARAGTLVHGHTHRPAEHPLGAGLRRLVLPDWDAQSQPPRGGGLRLSAEGQAQRLPPA